MKKLEMPWTYDEFKQVGKDYALPEEADQYDRRHADFRDVKKENDAVLDTLGIQPGEVLIDFGAGTGAFAIQAAERGARVHAVDVSEAMLAHARKRASEAGTANISLHHAGFLTYEHEGAPADVITTTFAFHHLPDFWKGVALMRMHAMLRPGGKLYIHDVVLDETDALENAQAMIDNLGEKGGDFLRKDCEEHFSDEFSTYDWIMDGLLTRAGFTIQAKTMQDGVMVTYHCTRD